MAKTKNNTAEIIISDKERKIDTIINLSRAGKDIIADLKSGRNDPEPNIIECKKYLDVRLHDIFNKSIRKDKIVKKTDIEGNVIQGTEPVARIGLAIPPLIVNRAVSFVFGNDVSVESNIADEDQTSQDLLNALKKVLKDNKISTFNRALAREIFSYQEAAELWMPVYREKSTKRYGFDSQISLRSYLLRPSKGQKLYPYFDEDGDMIAFSREYDVETGSEKHTYFETWTAEYRYLWIDEELSEGFPEENIIKKIPVIYGRQDFMETKDVNFLIDRLEKLLSNFSDTNDYHASPKIFVNGTINGWSDKGEAGAILQADDNAKAKYLSWDQAPESVRLEIQTLKEFIYTITQTPDISFNSVKDIGAVTGIALKLLFMDAHLKVQDKKEIFDAMLERRNSVINSYLAYMNTSFEQVVEEIEIENVITPYMVQNEKDLIDVLYTATGGKAFLSVKSASQLSNLTTDAKQEYEQLKKEAEEERMGISMEDLTLTDE